jgi:hypothetical protein
VEGAGCAPPGSGPVVCGCVRVCLSMFCLILNYYRIHPSYFKLVSLLSICSSQLYKKKSIYVYKKNCSFILNLYIICIKNICHNFYGACLY